MTTTFFALTLLVAVGAETTDNSKKQTPNDAVDAMYNLLLKKDFAAIYETHCHKHLRDQINKAQFVDYMKSDPGAAIVRLFADVQAAIKEKKGEDVLVARAQEKPDEYEFILVQVKKHPSRKGQQWHLELKREDGKWKLMDTD
jgi:hypothetical protein